MLSSLLCGILAKLSRARLTPLLLLLVRERELRGDGLMRLYSVVTVSCLVDLVIARLHLVVAAD